MSFQMVAHKRSSFGMEAVFGYQITFHNNNQTVISQHVRHLGRRLGFSKNFICLKLQHIFLKLVENMCLQS